MADRLFVDLSGYAFTGKHAIIDLMREIEGVHVEHYQFEFALIRVQGGLHDLHHALCEDWSSVRSDAAIRRFQRVIERLGTRAVLSNPLTWARGAGWNYDAHYNGRFFELSRRYVDELVSLTWRGGWVFALADLSAPELLARRLARRLGMRSAFDFTVYLAAPDTFLASTRRYLADLLGSNVAPNTRAVVMHNAFEPFHPDRALKFFDRAKAIVVDRDPRDNYVEQLTYPPIALPVGHFVERYRLQRRLTCYDPHPDVLRLRFEDLVLDYERVVPQILAHVGAAGSHARPRQHFDPRVSRKNIGRWRGYAHPDEIRFIERELPEYCDERTAAA